MDILGVPTNATYRFQKIIEFRGLLWLPAEYTSCILTRNQAFPSYSIASLALQSLLSAFDTYTNIAGIYVFWMSLVNN